MAKVFIDYYSRYMEFKFLRSKEYCKVCGIEQIRTPPYWPQAKIAYQNKNNYKDEIQKCVFKFV